LNKKVIRIVLTDFGLIRRNRDFRLLFVGQFVSFIGSMVTYVAIPYQIYQTTKSSFLVGMLGTVQLVPLIVAALWGGVFADAIERRRLLIVSEALLVVGSLYLTINAHLAEPSIVGIFITAGVMSAINGFHRPAMEALKPQLVSSEDYSQLAAFDSIRYSFGAIVGPALGGLIIARFGLSAAYIIDVLSFGISLSALSKLKVILQSDEKKNLGLGSLLEGLKYGLSKPVLLGSYLIDLIAMTFAMPMALFPAISESYGGARTLGWLYAAMPLGSLFVAAFSAWTKKVSRHGAAISTAAGLWGVAILALGFSPTFGLSVFCLALAGAADAVSALFRSTLWNESIPMKMRGRMAGVEMLSYSVGPLLGNARAGYIAGALGNSISIWSGGLLCILGIAVASKLLPKFWYYRSALGRRRLEGPLSASTQ
jgi:MFS family permease